MSELSRSEALDVKAKAKVIKPVNPTRMDYMGTKNSKGEE